MADTEEPLDEDERGMAGLKLNIQNLNIMAPSPIFCWQIDRKTREGYGTPLQYSCLENPMDGGAW